ncbi:centrosomal protein of 192 kDa-like [Xenia sp. Carnegie-2017]|uniref:centrosomal protein of 192 kDa-like n=1 Tax=Xenia sp. Carnegie-2017 TaxID=2897299 RepID=UPI001F042AFB|nr:centrosomal protein of 192 kDa-like [Xenia sp. Carnegie-2017]
MQSREDRKSSRLSQTCTAFVKPMKQVQLLSITPTLIDFAEVEVNKASFSSVTIENISASSLRWKISSFAPAYAKMSGTDEELLRANYPVFNFSVQSGFIRPNQIVKVDIEFRARDAGDYCQIWDCQTNPESPLTSTKIKFELSGKAVIKKKILGKVEKDKEKRSNVALVSKRGSLPEIPSKDVKTSDNGKPKLYFRWESIKFPDTAVGQTSVAELKLCNKSSNIHQFRITQPSLPFYLKSTTLKSKPSFYMKIPAYFSPQQAGKYYESKVIFENLESSQHTLAVTLRGNSV